MALSRIWTAFILVALLVAAGQVCFPAGAAAYIQPDGYRQEFGYDCCKGGGFSQ